VSGRILASVTSRLSVSFSVAGLGSHEITQAGRGAAAAKAILCPL